MAAPEPAPWLERLGLHRPELRAWALYDWANSAFVLIVITAVFPVYFNSSVAAGLPQGRPEALFGWTTAACMAFIALLSPLLGTLGDYLGKRKLLLGVFLVPGVIATAMLAFVGTGDVALALVLFGFSNICVSGSFVYYDGLLPAIARDEELDRVSTSGYALGYLGSGLLLVGLLALFEYPGLLGLADRESAVRLGFVVTGAWWLIFSVPLFLRVKEPPARRTTAESFGATLGKSLRNLSTSLGDLRTSYRQAFLMLVAMLIYNDGIGTIIRMAGIYADAQKLPARHTIAAILLVQFIGIPFAFLFGRIAARIGAKTAVLIALFVYLIISIVAYRMDSVAEFYVLAILVGTVQGGAQALSRSLFASMVPRQRAAEFFGFFAVFEKFAGILGPLAFAIIASLTGSSQLAILSVIFFFILGGAVLLQVDVTKGQAQARAAEANLSE